MHVAGQGLIQVWRFWPGMRATARGAAGRGRVLPVVDRVKSTEVFSEGAVASGARRRSSGCSGTNTGIVAQDQPVMRLWVRA